mgnify:CR=1 FL=1
MIQKRNSQWGILVVLTILFFTIGCTTALRNKELEKVAKDWALVIRASQVIPVYPLTEDLQPGDVLLVRTPIEEQAKLYKKKGFLPLDQHLVRLYTKGSTNDFYDFYNARYGLTDEKILPPAQWQTATGNNKHNWGIAPQAAFPTYQFSVKTGSGLNLAIPIQGVPFALGLMNSGSASGTVTIAEAHTFGLDNFHLEKLVKDWAAKNRNLLRKYAPTGEKDNKKYHFLRVISRVYVTGRVNVTLKNDEATSAEAAAGADRTLKLMEIKDKDTADNYSKAITAINSLLKDQFPGVKTKIATASHRSVTLNEDFDRPLVIGYVGFDMPILEGGRLGAPISTLAQLTETITLPPSQIGDAYVYRLAAISHINRALKQLVLTGDEGVKDIVADLNKLSSLLPDQYPFTAYHQPAPNSIAPIQKIGYPVDKKRGFEAVVDYLGYADTSRELLEKYLKTAPQDTEEQKKLINERKQELQKVQVAIKEIENRLNGESVLMEAIDFVFFGK